MTREELIDYIDRNCIDEYGEVHAWMVADWHLAAVKRIVEPLYFEEPPGLDFQGKTDFVCNCIKEVVKRAGVEK